MNKKEGAEIDKIVGLLKPEMDKKFAEKLKEMFGEDDIEEDLKDRIQRCDAAVSEINQVLEKYKVQHIGILAAKSGERFTIRGLDNVQTKSDTALLLGRLSHDANGRLYD
tara:strand:- start:2684 stop:3013 length:330 start_codon:yes stop_codon:yes gene_type:complete